MSEELPQRHRDHREISSDFNELSRAIIDAGLKVHKFLGPGLLESTYEHCLAHELVAKQLRVERQVPLPIVYDGVRLDAGYRLDMIVQSSIVIEIKSVDLISKLHEAQLLTYLKLSGYRLGLLLNFNVSLFKQGIRRLVV